MIFAPIHWSAENSSHGRIGALVHPLTDATSGQPDSKATPARIAPVRFRYQGFIVSRSALSLDCAYWVRVRQDHGWLYLVAMNEAPATAWHDWLPKFVDGAEDCEILELSDGHGGAYRAAVLRQGQLEIAVVLTAKNSLPASGWLARLLGEAVIDGAMRRALLAGRLPESTAAQGPIVCACFGVDLNRIGKAIAEQGLSSVAAIGRCLKAGTNCGSCIPELKRILGHKTAAAA
jgi:assimilatory nitrate reductase catalytic subunit